MNPTGHRPGLRRLHGTAAALALAALLTAAAAASAAVAAAASRPAPRAAAITPVRTIRLVAHERHHVFLDLGPHGPSLGDQSIFAGTVNNASDTARLGSFGGTLTSITTDDSVFAATVDLQLPGGQLTIQGLFDGSAARFVHAVTGGTGIYVGARGQFSFTEPAPGILDITITLLAGDRDDTADR